MGNFYTELAELLEVDNIDPACCLEEYENWDSLTILSLIVMLNTNFNVTMSSKEIRDCETAEKLFEAVQQKETRTK